MKYMDESQRKDNAKIARLNQLIEEARKEAETNFGYWKQAIRQQRWPATENAQYVAGVRNLAEAARAETMRMGIELNKLQKRIGRQRVANSKLIYRSKELELKLRQATEENRELRETIERYKDATAGPVEQLRRELQKRGASRDGTDFKDLRPTEEPERYSPAKYGPGTPVADGERPKVQGAVDKAGRKSVPESMAATRARIHQANARAEAEERLRQEEGQG